MNSRYNINMNGGLDLINYVNLHKTIDNIILYCNKIDIKLNNYNINEKIYNTYMLILKYNNEIKYNIYIENNVINNFITNINSNRINEITIFLNIIIIFNDLMIYINNNININNKDNYEQLKFYLYELISKYNLIASINKSINPDFNKNIKILDINIKNFNDYEHDIYMKIGDNKYKFNIIDDNKFCIQLLNNILNNKKIDNNIDKKYGINNDNKIINILITDYELNDNKFNKIIYMCKIKYESSVEKKFYFNTTKFNYIFNNNNKNTFENDYNKISYITDEINLILQNNENNDNNDNNENNDKIIETFLNNNYKIQHNKNNCGIIHKFIEKINLQLKNK